MRKVEIGLVKFEGIEETKERCIMEHDGKYYVNMKGVRTEVVKIESGIYVKAEAFEIDKNTAGDINRIASAIAADWNYGSKSAMKIVRIIMDATSIEYGEWAFNQASRLVFGK